MPVGPAVRSSRLSWQLWIRVYKELDRCAASPAESRRRFNPSRARRRPVANGALRNPAHTAAADHRRSVARSRTAHRRGWQSAGHYAHGHWRIRLQFGETASAVLVIAAHVLPTALASAQISRQALLLLLRQRPNFMHALVSPSGRLFGSIPGVLELLAWIVAVHR